MDNSEIKYLLSDCGTIKFDLPQRSILGSLLFNLFMNYMRLYISNADSAMPADDAIFSVTFSNACDIQSIVHNVLSSLENWCINNKLIINLEKTNII